MKHLTFVLTLVVLFTSFSNEVLAQSAEPKKEEVFSPMFMQFIDTDGQEGLIFRYTGNLKSVNTVTFGVGSEEYSFDVRMKYTRSPNMERGIFILDPKKRINLSEDGRVLTIDQMPVMSMSVSFENSKLEFQ